MKKLRPEQKTIVKRGAMLAAIMLLLVAAAWMNGVLEEDNRAASASGKPVSSAKATATPSSTTAAQSKTGDYFQDFRADRATVRADEIALLDSVIEAGKDKEAMAAASERKIELSKYMEIEFALEKTLLAKGYDDVAVIVRESLVTIAVKKAELGPSDAAKILEAARLETGMDADSVKIIPVQ